MIRLRMYKNHGRRKCVCRTRPDEQVVREGQAYSPADMARLTEKGMPVNSLMTGKTFIDGEENPSFFVPAERGRHVDVCDLWEQHMVLRDKARSAARAKKTTKKE